MGKSRDLYKKIGDIKATFHARMGTVKDRNGKNLTDTEEIKKRWKEYTGELYKKGLMTQPQWCGHSPRVRHPGV